MKDVIVMFLPFIEFVQKEKRNFKRYTYEVDIQYRAVVFRQFGSSYQRYCDLHQICHEYEKLAYDIRAYEKRIQNYRNS